MGWSEAGEVVIVDCYLGFGLAALLFCIALGSSSLFSLLGGLRAESKTLKVLIKTSPGDRLFDCILCLSFVLPLALFGFKDGQFFLLDPVSLNILFLDRTLLFESVVDINTFVSVVLFKSQSLRLLWLRFWDIVFSCYIFVGQLGLLRLILDVLVLVELILDISNVSFSSSSLSGSVTILVLSYTLPVPLCLSWKCPSPNFLVRGVGGCLGFLICLALSLICSGYCSVMTVWLVVSFCAAFCCCCL